MDIETAANYLAEEYGRASWFVATGIGANGLVLYVSRKKHIDFTKIQKEGFHGHHVEIKYMGKVRPANS